MSKLGELREKYKAELLEEASYEVEPHYPMTKHKITLRRRTLGRCTISLEELSSP